MSTSSISTQVTTNASAVVNDLRDIKPPVDIPSGWAWLWWALLAVGLIAALAAIWYASRQRLRAPPMIPVLSPHARAKQKLAEALALIGEPKPFCVAVSDAARVYLEERFNFRAPERTTEEFLRELGNTDLLALEQKQRLADFLGQCDLVKFARYEPREPELRDLHDSALRLVEETEPGPESPNAATALQPQSATA